MSNNKGASIPVVFAIAGGTLLLINSIFYIASLMIGPAGAWLPTWTCPCGMMWRWGGPMMAWPFTGMMIFTSIIGLIAGVLLIISGLMIHTSPKDATLWGIIILTFSIVGFLSGGGFIIGSLIGIIGGIIAITMGQSTKNPN